MPFSGGEFMKKKRILIVGILGNMGRRYASILKFLGHEVEGVDAGYSLREYASVAEVCDGIIIASPTCTHIDEIAQALGFDMPILCEKPITTDLKALDTFDKGLADKGKALITMVNQYEWLVDGHLIGPTLYNYFSSGGDGLAWDCTNIIGMASGYPSLSNDSPIWNCMINGKILKREEMDKAYIDMMEHWLQYPDYYNWEYILESHAKVGQWLES
jgi:hypothetical protein